MRAFPFKYEAFLRGLKKGQSLDRQRLAAVTIYHRGVAAVAVLVRQVDEPCRANQAPDRVPDQLAFHILGEARGGESDGTLHLGAPDAGSWCESLREFRIDGPQG